MRRIDRREFAKEAGLAFLTGVSVTVSACGGGGGGGYSSSPTSSSTPPPATASGDKIGTISANHGHSAVIVAAWLQAGGQVALDIRGTATHTHSVIVVANAMADIKAEKPVQMESSSTDGHTHLVTFNADSPAPPTRY